MDLLNRYLQAVRFWLPKDQQEDIAAELREDLESRIEEREAGLGRRLADTEIAGVLKTMGRPILVANRYRPQQSLIGPVLYPIYLFVLKIIGLCYLVPWVLVFVCLMLFDHSYSSAHPWGESIVDAARTLLSTCMVLFAAATITFAVLERAQAKSKWMEKWEPVKLPAVRDGRQIKRANSIAEIIFNLAFAAWWLNGWGLVIVLAPTLHIVLAPISRSLLIALLLVTVANVVLSATNLARPYWTGLRIWFRVALDAAGGALFCWMLKAQLLAGIIAPSLPAAKEAMLVHTINSVMARTFPLAVLFCVFTVVLSNASRLWQMRSSRGLPGGLARPAQAG